jgi:hypothetical protein
MITRRAPRRLSDVTHAWHVKPASDNGPLIRAVQPALTAVYVLHHHGVCAGSVQRRSAAAVDLVRAVTAVLRGAHPGSEPLRPRRV